MKRRQFISTLGAGATLSTALATRASTSSSEPRPLVSTPLVIMAPRADGFEAVWGVNRLSTGKIQWETEDGTRGEAASNSFGFVPQGEKVLRVRVTGLAPGKSYRVKALTTAAGTSDQHTSETKTVRTLDPRAPSTQFVVWNDTHIHDSTIQQLHALTPSADFLLWNGDTCNDWTSPGLLVPTILHPGQSDITNGRPLFLTMGNHDVRGPRAFELPEIVATPNQRPFYAFRSGPVAALCLHTGEDKPDSHPSFRGRVAFQRLRQEQARWLEETIQRPEIARAPYRIVFCHIPLRWRDENLPDYQAGGFDRVSLASRELWHPFLVQWQAQLIISGHTHQSAFFPATAEFPYAQLIGGGPQPKSATWMQATANSRQATITVRNLDGATKHEVTLSPLA